MVQATPLINPGEEASLRCSGKWLQDPFRDVSSVLDQVVEEMFAPETKGTTQELADIFWSAEKAYFTNANFPDGGELCLEPLFSKIPGRPTYLEAAM